MAQVVTNPSPKARYQESQQNVSKHRDLIGSNDFQRAADFALLEYQAQLSKAAIDNFNNAAASHIKMTGALEFLQIFRNLAEAPRPSQPTPANDNLNFRA